MKNQNEIIVERFSQMGIEFEKNPTAQSGYLVDGKPIDEKIFDKWVNYIQRYFKIAKRHRLLDVGCGSGIFLKRFHKFTSHLWGGDPAAKLLKTAQILNPGAEIRSGTLFDAGFKDIKFERLFCNSVFHYLNSQADGARTVNYFFKITSSDAKIWIGDVPMPNPALCDKNYRRVEKSSGWSVQHYAPQFFYEICDKHKYECRVLYQEVEDKISAAYRYDVLITK